ncbi:MAG: hypothetical protein AAGA60_32005, partial [Cyanobacteria bacterium P01_E01_bin.42]
MRIFETLAKKSPAFKRVYLGILPQKYAESGAIKKYYELLTNFDFLAAKIAHPEFGVQALIEDYDVLAGEAGFEDGQKSEVLKVIQGALRLSAHILSEDSSQLAEQLLGRLMAIDLREIHGLLEQGTQRKQSDWLRPITPSLTPPGGQLIRTLSGHRSGVRAVSITPDGKQAISASSDKTLKIWNLETGNEHLTLSGHRGGVRAVSITPDGKQAISASDDNTLKIWNLETGNERLTLSGHRDGVNAVSVAPDGKQAISASSDNTLKIWDLETGDERLTLSGHRGGVRAVSIAPDGKQAISASSDKTLKIWDLETGNERLTLSGHRNLVTAVSITPDGKQAISASSDKTLKIWDLETGNERLTLSGHR